MYVRGHEYLLGPSPWVSSEKGPAFYFFSLKRQNMQRLKESGFKNSICKYYVRIINRSHCGTSKIGLMFQSYMIFCVCH